MLSLTKILVISSPHLSHVGWTIDQRSCSHQVNGFNHLKYGSIKIRSLMERINKELKFKHINSLGHIDLLTTFLITRNSYLLIILIYMVHLVKVITNTLYVTIIIIEMFEYKICPKKWVFMNLPDSIHLFA